MFPFFPFLLGAARRAERIESPIVMATAPIAKRIAITDCGVSSGRHDGTRCCVHGSSFGFRGCGGASALATIASSGGSSSSLSGTSRSGHASSVLNQSRSATPDTDTNRFMGSRPHLSFL